MPLVLVLLMLPAVGWVRASDADAPAAISPVEIEYFFEPGCSDCARVDSGAKLRLEAEYAGLYRLQARDIGFDTNYARLAAYLDRFHCEANEHVFMVVAARDLLAGPADIERRLLPLVGVRIQEALAPSPTGIDRTGDPPPERSAILERARQFTAPGVAVAGLIDGLNPCAISTLVFFISLLGVSRVSGRRLLAAGCAFCLASFLTYFAIGFGMMRALHLFRGFGALQGGIEWTMVAVLLVFAGLSFRDAARYGASRNPKDVTLQLPSAIKDRMHALMRERLTVGRLSASAFGIGAAVTVLESVCTGQVYVPTLVYVVRGGAGVGRGLAYLLLYNLAFVVPLAVVFALTYQGLKLQSLIAWSMRNVVISKILLGVFFLLMAALIVWL